MYESSYLVFLLQTLVALVQTVEDLLKHLLLLVHFTERLVDLRLELTNRRHDEMILINNEENWKRVSFVIKNAIREREV